MAIPRSLRVWRTRRWGVLTAVLALLAGALAGCAVGPDYKRPEVSAPAEWRSPSEGPGSLTDLGWWELFQDPMLPGLVRTAVEENKDVQVAVARVAEARAQLGIARAARFPQVDGPARPKPWDLATRARRAEIGSRCKSWTVDASY